MSKVFFTSDQHFGHKNVIRYCNRPFTDLDEMKRDLITNHNAAVGPNDTVYMLGDIFFCGLQEAAKIMAQLNGYKILIRGNHDVSGVKMVGIGFNEVHENCEVGLGGIKFLMSHFPYKPFLGDIPKEVLHSIEHCKNIQQTTGMDRSSTIDLIIDNFLASGLINQDKADRLKSFDMRFLQRRIENKGQWLLCGHVHEKWAEKNRMINVGVDVRDFRPISSEEIVKIAKKGSQDDL